MVGDFATGGLLPGGGDVCAKRFIMRIMTCTLFSEGLGNGVVGGTLTVGCVDSAASHADADDVPGAWAGDSRPVQGGGIDLRMACCANSWA